MGARGWALPTTHTWEDAPGHHGSQKRNALALGDGKLKHITAGCRHRLPWHCWARCRKGMRDFVPDPESSPTLPTPRSVVIGLLLTISQSAALGQVGSAVALPGRILSPWESHRVRMKPTPPSPSAPVPTPDPVAPTRASEGASPCSGTGTQENPCPGCVGPSIRRGHRCGLVCWEPECMEGLGPGILWLLGSLTLSAEKPACASSSRLRAELLLVPALGLVASARTLGTLILEINCSHDSHS